MLCKSSISIHSVCIAHKWCVLSEVKKIGILLTDTSSPGRVFLRIIRVECWVMKQVVATL